MTQTKHVDSPVCDNCNYSLWGHSLALPDRRVDLQNDLLEAMLDSEQAICGQIKRLRQQFPLRFDAFLGTLAELGIKQGTDLFNLKLQEFVLFAARFEATCPECGTVADIPDPSKVTTPP